MAIVNCMASSSSAHMPPPQASTVSLSVAPAPSMARIPATTVRIMHTTHESGIHLCVKRDKLSPRFPTAVISPDIVQGFLSFDAVLLSAGPSFCGREPSQDGPSAVTAGP